MTEPVVLNGTKKNDVFEIELGSGKTYEIDGKNGGKDTILFLANTSIGPANLTYTQVKDGDTLTKDLEISYSTNNNGQQIVDKVIIKDYFTSPEATSTKSSIKHFKTDTGTFLLSDWITYNGEYSRENGVIKGTVFSDSITGTDENDKIYGKGGFDEILGGAGNDYINSSGGAITMLNGGEDNDTIKAGKNTLSILVGEDGDDKIYTGSSLISMIDGGAGNDTIYAGNSYKNNAFSSNEELNMIFNLFGGGDSNSLKIISGGEGDDKIYAGSGCDIFGQGTNLISSEVTANFGHDIIYSAKENDILLFKEDFNNLTFKKEGNNLVIEEGEDSSVTLSKFFKGKKGKVLDKIMISGDDNLTQKSILNDAIINITGEGKINGTNYNDYIHGSDKKDKIKTGNGVNIIDGNGGDDYIDSTKGNNTIIINQGDGNDTILAGANSETHLLFDPYKEFSFTKKGNDLIITHQDAPMDADLDDEPNNAPETVTLKNYFKTDKKGNLLNKNVTINHDEYGSIYNRQDLLEILQYENIGVYGKENKANTIDLRKYNDTFNFEVYGGNKNDKIYLGSGYNEVYSGAGNDTITVGNGNNIIGMGAGNDKVKAGNGDNEFYYTSGKDVIESGVGDDKYYVEYSSDMNLTIKDNGGYDRLYMEDIDSNNLHAFCHFDKNGDLIVSNNELYIFGEDEDGNSMLNYENIVKGMKGKDMSGVIKIENYFEKTYNPVTDSIEMNDSGRGRIELCNDTSFIPSNGLSYEVASWLSSYKNGYFESSIDVLSRGSQDDINAMLNIYNGESLSSSAPV